MTRGFDVKRLLPPNEALERYFARVALATPPAERVALDAARSRVLASRIEADDEYPATARSSMDGFAVASSSTPGTLRLVGEIAIGTIPPRAIEPGETMRISTGGVIPEGADAVVPIEDVALDGDDVRVAEQVTPRACIVARGSDMHEGERLLDAGRRIGSPELAVLASLGIVEVPVYRMPLVAVISSGDELVPPSERPLPGRVRDSNRYAIAASLEALGARVRHEPIVRDVDGALERALRDALETCDAVVISGGSSVGGHDLTPVAVASLGEPGVVVHGLRVRPGKPTLLAAAGVKPIIGLPGNPLSALMMLEAVTAPIFAALAGAAPAYEEVDALLRDAIRVPAGWTWYVPVTIDDANAVPLPMHSFATSLASRASGYVCATGDRERAAGETVRVRRFLCGGRR